MKYIFDFDDVLFNNTVQFKPHMYDILEKAGVPKDAAQAYYRQIRAVNEFWLKDLLRHFSLNEDLYEKIVDKDVIKNFINHELIAIVKKLGKENCFILTHGGEKFQLDKIEKSGIAPLFADVIAVFGKKNDSIEKICATHRDEEVFFIDDRIEHSKDLNTIKCPNLKTILYTGQDLRNIIS